MSLTGYLISSAVYYLAFFKKIFIVFHCCNSSVSHSSDLTLGAEIFYQLVLTVLMSLDSSRLGPTRRGFCKWDTPCGRAMAPTWSRCQITDIWRWPLWRRGPLSLWRQWTQWLVHVSATLYPVDDSPTRQRRKWCCHISTVQGDVTCNKLEITLAALKKKCYLLCYMC